MITYYSGNRLSALAGRLSNSLKENQPDDLLKPQTIIVPNRDTAKWLQLYLSDHMGIAANLMFLLPAEWHWKRIRDLYPGLPKTLPSDPEPMKWTLYDILSDPQTLSQFDRLYHYISVQSEETRESAILKLSRQLASVFDQYMIYRPEMILNWDSGRADSEEERWQAKLWKILSGRWRSGFEEPVSLHKAKLFQNTESAFRKEAVTERDPLFLFNPGLIPVPILRLADVWSDAAPVFLYQNTPTANLDEKMHCSLLSALGEEAAGIEDLYGRVADQKVEVFEPFDKTTLLGAVQGKISNNQPDSLSGSGMDDSKIQIRSCHSQLREIETLHQFILEQFEVNPGLKAKDILVVTPDLTHYEEYIEAVFGTAEEGMPDIPYRTPKTGYHPSMQFKNGFLELLNLLTSRFTYNDVIDLFLSKPVLEGLGISETDGSRVRQWLDDNYIIWGIDSEHRAEWGQPEQETHTWKRALDRIWLGDLLGPAGEDKQDLDRYSGVRSVSDRNCLAAFSRYFNFLKQCRKSIQSPKKATEWCDLFEKWATQLFSKVQVAEGDGIPLLSAIEALRSQIETAEVNSSPSFSLIRSELERVLRDSGGSSARFTDGVTFSTMVPVRGLPFKLIALIGLNEESFPRRVSSPDFDLMARKPRLHERDRKKEDKALFLESILSAGEIHYCSYIGQDRVDNERRPPSPIVSAWTDYLGRLTGKEPDDWVRHEALSGFSAGSFRQSGLYSKNYFKSMRSIHSPDRERIGGLQTGDSESIEKWSGEVELSDLIRFYTNHSDWFLKQKFDARIRDTDEERDEFSTGALEKHLVFRQLFTWRLQGLGEDAIREIVLNSGILPEGWAGVKEYGTLMESSGLVLSLLNEMELDPELIFIDISNNISGNNLTGSVESYSNKRLVQVNPSVIGGKNLFKAWLNHLAVQAAGTGLPDESWLIGETKKGNPRTFRFKRVENAAGRLSELLGPYMESGLKPFHFFPETVYEYLSADPQKDIQNAISMAKKKFEGGEYAPFSERNSLQVKLLYGPGVEFSRQFLSETLQDYMRVMNEYLEEE